MSDIARTLISEWIEGDRELGPSPYPDGRTTSDAYHPDSSDVLEELSARVLAAVDQ